MEKLQVINHPQFGQLSVIILDGKEMFKAKECAAMLGYKDTINAIKQHCKGVVKHHLPTKSGVQEVNLISEGDLWRLIIRSKLPQAMEIEKWIMDEVLPTLRKTGEYKMNYPKQPYEYFDKTYNKEPVLTLEDAAYLTGLKSSTIDTFLRKHCLSREDYYLLNESSLCRFKNENPKLRRNIPKIIVITKSGFKMLCDSYGIKIDEPKQFAVKPAFEQLALPDNSEDDTEKMLKQIKLAKEKTAAVNALLEKFAEYVAYKNGNTMEKTIYDYYVPAYKRVLSSFGIKLDS